MAKKSVRGSSHDAIKRVSEASRRVAEDAGEASSEAFQRATDTAQNKLSSFMASGSVIANGLQSISKEIFECTQQGMQKQIAHINEFAKCKSPSDVFALQTQIYRENVEDFIASSRRISDVAKAMAEEATLKLKDISRS